MPNYGFDLHTFLKHSPAEPAVVEPSAAEVRAACHTVTGHFHKLDNQQLAALLMAVETEHVNRQAALAGQQPVYNIEW